MGRAQLRAAIRQLLRLVSPREGVGLTDGQLLERFTRHRDEAAFETLLWRHGPMVLRTCQRVLRRPQDAEDAFQATFLVFCRKAARISSQDSVGGWLYKVAYRIALRARTSEARHAAEGLGLQGVPARESAAEAGADDLRGVLDEELNRLPEKYRLPLVLHYLEGKTVEQVAAELGWAPGTVSGRLARAKQLLRPRLTRRRVVAGALLTGAAMASAEAEACPGALMDATLRAAGAFSSGASVVPAGSSVRAVTLARAALRGMLLARLKVAAGILALLGAAAVAAGLMTRPYPVSSGTVSAAPRVASEAGQTGDQPTPPPDGARRLSFSGRVVDTEGNPIPGARVDLREWAVCRMQGMEVEDVLATTFADADGQFAFRDVAAPVFPGEACERLHPWDVVARAEGRGLAWQHLTPKVRQAPVTLTLAREHTIEGRLVNPGGDPVAGALVHIVAVAPLGHGPVTPFTAEDGVLNLNWSQLRLVATSDADGRFALHGLPPDRRCDLGISKAGHVDRTCPTATTSQLQPNLLGFMTYAPSTTRVEPVLTGALTLTLQPEQRLRGRVLFADTGRPAAGARLMAHASDGPAISVTADAEGKFTVDGLPPGPWDVTATDLRADSEYLPAFLKVEAAESSIRLPRGSPVTGSVVDAETGQGIADAEVVFDVAASPPGSWPACATPARTDRDGKFRMVLPAGRWTVLAGGLSSGYPGEAKQPVTVQAGQPLDGLRFVLARGLTVKGRVMDPRGSAVTGAEVRVQLADQPGTLSGPVVTDAEGSFTWGPSAWPSLLPDQDYAWVVMHRGQNLGARILMSRSGATRKSAALEVRLQPLGAVAGRVVNEDGRPLADAVLRVRTYVTVPGGDIKPVEAKPEELDTDAEGRFRVDGLLPAPGFRYALEVSAGGCAGLLSAPFRVLPGQTGALPELVLPPARLSVSGTVVDREGRPLADAQVTVRPRGVSKDGGNFLAPDPVVTAGDGRFVIRGLPAGAVDIEAELYVAGQEVRRGEQRPTVHTRAEAGQGDVRVAFPDLPRKGAHRPADP